MEKKENIVMFPFMAQGHIIPFLALALQIEKRGYQITFINTPANIKNLHSTLPPSSAIRLLPIAFNSSDHGLPLDSENTDSLPYDLVLRFIRGCTSLKPAFANILSKLVEVSRPLCVISDIHFGWTAEVSRDLGIFHVIFGGCGGFGLACYYSTWINLPHKKADTVDFTLPDFPEAGNLQRSQLTPSLLSANEDDPWLKFQHGNLPLWANGDGLLMNTVEELDKIGLLYFRRKFNRPVWAIGPILLSVDNRAKSTKSGRTTPEYCKEWLDRKRPSSVLYICFGSQNTISATSMVQLANALDQSGKEFIWVVRPPLGFDLNLEFKAEEWLPEGFTGRIAEQKKGLIIEKWAPQVEILSHKSVGAFLSHCGWNSVLESLGYGVPLIGWPMQAEQFYNVKFLEEVVEVCLEVARGASSEVRWDDIVEKVELVMNETGKGAEMRRKASEIQEMIKDATRDKEGFKGSSEEAMEDFFKAALSMKEKINR